MTVLHVILGLLLVCSLVGYMLWAAAALRLAHEFVPVFVCAAVGCAVYIAGLFGVLFAGAAAVLAAGLLLFGFYIRPLIRGKQPMRISLFGFCFFVGSLLFLILLLQSHLTHYDNFSHWAVVVKQMLLTNAFPTASSDLIDFKNYPLGTASFLYFVCRFAGHSQAAMIVAQGALIFTGFYALFGIITQKKRFLLYAFLALGCSVLSVFNITIRINNLLVDFLLPVYTLVMFAAAYRYRMHAAKAAVAVLPVAGLLTVMKSTGVIFAAIGWIFLLDLWRRHRNQCPGRCVPAVLGSLVASFLPWLGWTLHMHAGFAHVTNKFGVTAGTIANIHTTKTIGEIHRIAALFVRSALDLSTRPALGLLAFNLAAVAACVFAAVCLKRKWQLWKALIALDAVVILYYLGILGLYIFSMPLSEALELAGFDRYASSIVVLFAGGLVLCATVDMENSFYYRVGEMPAYQAFRNVTNKHRYQEGIVACMAVAITLLLSEYNGLLSIQKAYSASLPCRVSAVTGDRWPVDGREDTHKYLFYTPDTDGQVTDYFLQYTARYFLYAPHVDAICVFYEPNMDHLLSQYDYLVVVEGDADAHRLLRQHYGVSGSDGIYRVVRLNGKVTLEPVQS